VTTEFVSVAEDTPVEEALAGVRRIARGGRREAMHAIYATDPRGRVKGVMSLHELLAAPEGALGEVKLRDWWRIAGRELPAGLVLGMVLGVIGFIRIVMWQKLGIFNYHEHYVLLATTVAVALTGVVTFGSLAGSMLPFVLRRFGFDPASASAPLVATLVDVTGLSIYFYVALFFLRGALL
jgi:Mg/Co/Ni transporter MgtE